MKLYNLLCLATSFLVTLDQLELVNGQTGVLETMAAILGLLPTSQILIAGGGLVGLKVAIALRILSILGVNTSRDSSPGSGVTQVKSWKINSTSNSINDEDEENEITINKTSYVYPSVVTGTQLFGLPKFDERFHDVVDLTGGDQVGDVTTSQAEIETPTSQPPIAEVSSPNSFFPIPGLKIDCENVTGICGILHMDSLFPSVFLPSDFANKSGIDFKAYENRTNPMFQLFKEMHPDQNFLYYPLFPTSVVKNSLQEPGFVSASNESQLLFGLSNGSFVSASEVDEMEFTGFHELHENEQDFDTDVQSNRSKRETQDNISMYLTLLNDLDDENCFSQLVCEIGADADKYGEYGNTVDKLFKSLNHTSFDVASDASHFISHYKYGQINGWDFCGRSSLCQQNLTQLIQPLNQLV